MADPSPAAMTEPPSPKSSALMLGAFADLYRQEIGAEEDVYRTLPFFGSALGIIIATLGYAAGRLPKWSDLPVGLMTRIAFLVTAALLTLAVLAAVPVLVFLSRAIVRRDYDRIGPEPALRARFAELRAFSEAQGKTGAELDDALLADLQEMLLDSYVRVTPPNRRLNLRRYRYRALASSLLLVSLICALAATTLILALDKIGLLPKVMS